MFIWPFVMTVSQLRCASLPSPSHLLCAPDQPHVDLVAISSSRYRREISAFTYAADGERLVAGMLGSANLNDCVCF